MARLQNTVLVLFLTFFTLVAGTVPLYFDASLRFASHLLLLSVVGGWLALLLRDRRGWPRTPIDLPLWLFLGSMALSTVFSINRRISVELLALNLLYGLLFYVWVDLLRGQRAESRLLKAMLLVATVVTGLALGEVVGWYFGLFPSLGFEQGWPQIGGIHLIPPVLRRTWLVMSVPNTLGAYLVLVLPLGIGVAAALSSRTRRVLMGAWAGLSVVALFFTFSRGAWLGFAASLPVLALSVRGHGALGALRARASARRRELVVAFLLAILVIVLIARPTAQLLSGRGSEGARMILYRNALEMAAERPILGYGLGTFGQVNLGRVSGTGLQYAVHGHAHNAYLNNLAELGIVGTAALLWLLFALARVAWTAVGRAGGHWSRALAGAAAAGLVGSAVQDLFETPLDQPAILFTSMILVAVLLEVQRRSAPADERRVVEVRLGGHSSGTVRIMREKLARAGRATLDLVAGRLLLPAALVGWAAIAAVLLYVGWANLIYAQGLAAAARSDWERAEERISRAVEMDPGLVFYRFELAYAEARVALARDDRSGLDRAARRFETALVEDGNYAQNYANLAMVYQHGGRSADAIAAMQDAIRLDTVNALYHLNLGFLYEQAGQPEAAIESYGRAIAKDSSLQRQSFWRATPQRRALWPRILGRTEADVTSNPQMLPPDAAGMTMAAEDADTLPTKGQPDQTLLTLDQLIARQPQYAQVRVERARVHLALGSLEEAEKDLRVALFIEPSPLTHYYLGELARIRGDRSAALQHFSKFAVARAVPTGYGTLVYRRDGILEPYLPGFVQFTLNDDLVEPVLGIASFHESIGATGRAAEIYARLLEYDPELLAAREGLTRTGG